MKIYRQPFKRTVTVSEIISGAIFIPLFICLFWNSPIFTAILTIGLCILLLMGACTTTQLFYVILTEDTLKIKNPVYFFWGGEYKYCEIKKVEIGYLGGFSQPFIRITTSNKKSWRYVIDLVARADYANLVQDFKQHGLEVETINMDRFLNNKKKS